LGAIVALTAAVGLLSGSLTGTVSAQTTPNALKACSGTVLAPGGATVTCDIVLTSSVAGGTQVGSPIVLQEIFPAPINGNVRIVNATVLGQDAIGGQAGFTDTTVTVPCFDNAGGPVGAECDLGGAPNCVNATPLTAANGLPTPVLIPGFAAINTPAANCIIFIRVVLQASAAATPGTVTEQVNIPAFGAFPGTSIPLTPVGGPVVIPAPVPAGNTIISLVGCQAGSGPISPSFTGPGVTSASAGASIACRIDLDDNDVAPNSAELVGSGLVTFSVSSGTVTAIGGSSVVGTTVTTGSATSTCGRTSAGVTADDTCDFIDVRIDVPAGATPGSSITLTVNYTPDNVAWNTPATATFTIGVLLQSAIQPTGFAISCTPGTAGTLPTFLPGPIGGATVVAISVLPSSIACTVQTTVGGVPTAVANGVIEVSTVTGTLIDSRGALSTNLRIPCTNTTLTAPNNCTGVAFAIAGAGVGFVEIRLRYEPVPFGTNVGTIAELEGSFVVAFVAPRPNLDLNLSPNPVSVGQDTTATLRLNRVVINCGVGIFCVNPTTGLPLLTNTSSILNGTVVFTIDNTAIARFQQPGVQTNTAGTTVGTAVVGSAGQVTVRCGTLSDFAGSFESFFGGCDTATANIRALVAGTTTVSAAFIPDLPGAISSVALGGAVTPATVGSLTNFGGLGVPVATRQLQVLDAPATGNITLVRGCNNVTPTVTEAVSAYIARVMGTQVFAIWEHQAATNTFLGAPGPGAPAGAPADLTTVTRLRPVFVCVNGPGSLNQPAA
jgi:hypothetical protein